MIRFSLGLVLLVVGAILYHGIENAWIIIPVPAVVAPDPIDRTPDPNEMYV